VVGHLEPVKSCRSYRIVSGGKSPGDAENFLVAREDRLGFRAVKAAALAEQGHLAAAPEILKALAVTEGDRVDAVPLP